MSTSANRVEAVLVLAGDLDQFRFAGGPLAGRADGLWRRTCFEVFSHAGNGAYTEANVTPDGAWNLYRFDQYRTGMRELITPAPEVTFVLESHTASLRVCWAGFPTGTAVKPTLVLATNETTHYFAPDHAEGMPDFHTTTGAATWEDDLGTAT